jgi:hypothetical protein
VRNRGRWAVRGLGLALLVLVGIAVLGGAVMLLWNALVPTLFHGPAIAYRQAVGLLVLCRLLFGGLRARGGWHGPWRQRMWRERWEQMTPEERARLRERYQSRCGHGARAGEATPPAA